MPGCYSHRRQRNSSWLQDVGVPLLAALVGALFGGGAAAVGSSIVVKRDLIERNRHALFMEDLKAFEAAVEKADRMPFDGRSHDEISAALGAVPKAVRQIKVRALILGGEEKRLGKLIDESADHEVLEAQVKALTDCSEAIIDKG